MLDDMNDLELKREKGEVSALYNLTGCNYDMSLNYQFSVGAINYSPGQANTGLFIMSNCPTSETSSFFRKVHE